MAHESQDQKEKLWPSHVEHVFIEIMLEEQLKGNMAKGVFKGSMWTSITTELNQRTGKDFIPIQVQQKHNRLRTKQRKWSQMLRHTGLGWDEQTQTVTCSEEVWQNVVAISSNTPPLNSDKERALEEELANANDNASAPTHLDDDCYTPNFDTFPHTVEDAEVEEVTQRAEKRLVPDASGKGKKVSKKSDRVSEMTVALREYTAMSRDKFSGKLGKGCGSSEQFAQSAVGGDPCSLPKAIKVLNSYADLSNKAYIKMSKVLQQKDDRVVFMCMPEYRRKSWIDAILNSEED
nr:l10-interacting myb domain-containing protein [Quercus suber]